jgi:methyl-accepting chemotaxis protein
MGLGIKGMKIRKKIMVVILFIAGAILIVSMGFYYFLTRNFVVTNTKKTYNELLTKQFEYIEYWMERHVENIEKIAQSNVVISYSRSGPFRSAEDNAARQLKDSIDTLVGDKSEFFYAGIIKPDGTIGYFSNGRKGSLKDDVLFQKVRNSKDIVIGSIEKGNKTMLQPIAYPVYSESGERGGITGYIIAAIDLALMKDSISMLVSGVQAKCYVIDVERRVVLSSDVYEFEADSQKITKYNGSDIPPIARMAIAHRSGNERYSSHDGTSVIGIWKFFSYFEWLILLEIDNNEIIAPLMRIMGIIAIAAMALIITAIFIAFYTAGQLSRPLEQLTEAIHRVADGDLTVKVTADDTDEIGLIAHSVNQLTEKTSAVIRQVQTIATQLSVSSVEVSATTTEFSENINSQASSAEQIMATVENVSAGIESINTGANEQFERTGSLIGSMSELSGLIDEMESKIKDGLTVTGEINDMARVGSKSLTVMNESIISIGGRTSEMMNIIKVIRDISDQINLLSLNAAIEAARAGEMGRGFAVVADEISKLADQTSQSLKEIDTLVKHDSKEISTGLANVQQNVDIITKIIGRVTEVSETMRQISVNMEKQLGTNEKANMDASLVRNKADEIRKAIQAQKDATNEIVQAITIISSLLQNNASGSEEMSASSEELSAMAEKLKEQIEYFKG